MDMVRRENGTFQLFNSESAQRGTPEPCRPRENDPRLLRRKKEVTAGFFPAEWEAYKNSGKYPEERALDEHAIAYYENMPDAEWYKSRHAAKLSDFTDAEIVAEFNRRLDSPLFHKIGIESRAIIKGENA